ncbi:MAG: multiheme c-type cytochrome [Sandaracinaceae bacterium]
MSAKAAAAAAPARRRPPRAFAFALGALAAACGEPAAAAPPPAVTDAVTHTVPALLLPASGPRRATQVRLVDGDPADAETLADVATCAACHADVHGAWAASAHARASFDNPFYRQAVDDFRADVGRDESAFCAGCHDPVLLVAGTLDADVEPEDPLASAGITCRVCHGIQEVRPDGSGSYTLSTAPIPLPDPGDAASVGRHARAATPAPLRTASMCGACHRGFLSPAMGQRHHLPGLDDLGPWRRSGYGESRATRLDEPVDARRCQGCHMPSTAAERGDMAARRGRVRSHRFAGAQTQLAASPAQLEAHRELLEGSVRGDVAALRYADGRVELLPRGADLGPGDEVELDVVLRNERVGHAFPGGLRDVQDVWLEVEVRDRRGRRLAEAGARHGHGAGDDPTAHRLRAWVVDGAASRRDRHLVQHFRAALFDRTLGPRDAAVVRYRLQVPAWATFPLEVRARLRHRRHPRPLREAACAAQRSARGQAFDAAVRRRGRPSADACAEAPITDLGESRTVLDPALDQGSRAAADAPAWRRLFDLGLGLAGQVQEHLDEARAPLEAALRLAPGARRPMILGQLARVAARQGRVEEALDHAARAEELGGPHPALDRVRGDALAQVWRWPEAAEAYGRAAREAPRDDDVAARWAQALGSAGRDLDALAAAQHGLALAPRREDLLRSQALAARALDHPEAAAALAAYLAHRTPDDLNALRIRCAQDDPECARTRVPVPRIDLRPAAR